MPLSVQNQANAPARRAARLMSPVSRHHSSAARRLLISLRNWSSQASWSAPRISTSPVLGQLHVDVGVAVAGLVGVELGEGLQGVGAQGVEQPVSVVTGPSHHRLLHQ